MEIWGGQICLSYYHEKKNTAKIVPPVGGDKWLSVSKRWHIYDWDKPFIFI